MRYKPRPERERDLHPLKLDASDLEHMLELAGEGATIKIGTKRCEYDGPEDLVKNLHWRAKLEDLEIVYTKFDSIKIVPHFFAYGERAKKASPAIEAFLQDYRRRPVRLWGLIIGIVVGYCVAVMPTVAYHARAHGLELAHFNPIGWGLVFGVSSGASEYLIAPLLFRNIVVPRKRDGSWARQHLPAIIVGVVCAVVGAIATKIFS